MYTGWARGVVCTLEILMVAPIFILAAFEKAKIFDFKVFRKIGESSYPIYLIHQNVGFMLEWLLIEHFSGWNYFIPTIVFIISLATGIIIFYLVERPMQSKRSIVGIPTSNNLLLTLLIFPYIPTLNHHNRTAHDWQ